MRAEKRRMEVSQPAHAKSGKTPPGASDFAAGVATSETARLFG